MSSTEAEYVVAPRCCANILWMKIQLTDYDIIYEMVPIFCDSTSAIAISNNPFMHSRTKHVGIRYHFIRDHILKGDIELHFIPTQYQLADIFTKPLDEPTFKRLIVELDQVEFTFNEITFITNNEVALIYPDHLNSEYFYRKAFTIAPTQYVEYLAEFWYNREIGAKGTLKKSCLPPSPHDGHLQVDVPLANKAPNTSSHDEMNDSRDLMFGAKVGTKKKHSKHNLGSKEEATKSQPSSKEVAHSPTGHSKNKKNFSTAKDKALSQPLVSTPVDTELHKEDLQAAGDPTSLGVTSEERAHPQLSSSMSAFTLIKHGMDEGTQNYSLDNKLAGTNLSVLVDKTKFARDGLKTAHTDSGINEESIADEILKKIKLEDLSDLMKDIRSAFFTRNSLQDKPIIVSDESEEEETKKDEDTHATSHDVPEDTSVPHPPSPKSAHIPELMAQVAEPKNIQWELPVEFLDLPSQVSLVHGKLKTLDSLLSLLNKVTDTLNRFSTMVKTASGAASKNVSSACQAIASPAEGAKNTNPATRDAEPTNLHNELVDLLGIDIMKQYYNKKLLYDKYCDNMLKRRKSSKIINCNVLTQKGPITLQVYRATFEIQNLSQPAIARIHHSLDSSFGFAGCVGGGCGNPGGGHVTSGGGDGLEGPSGQLSIVDR
ncbi:hypothetical protein Tco_0213825 [Tanacetum coccineum]